VKINVRPWDDQSVVAMREEHSMINFDMPLPTGSVLNVMFNSRGRATAPHGRSGMSSSRIGSTSLSSCKRANRVLEHSSYCVFQI
jgi:hypothetical protein